MTGSFAIPGVPGTGAEIAMNWADTVGAKTGTLLPTGNPVDDITLEDGRTVKATLCDAANPCVWVFASEFGLRGSETLADINGNRELIGLAREVRGKAAVLFGMLEDWREVDAKAPAVPMVGFVAPPQDYCTLNGAAISAGDMDVHMRLVFMNRLHESVAGTGSICIAAASRVKGSTVESVCENRAGDVLLIGHPSGVTPARVKANPTNKPPFVKFETLGFSRTSRRLMTGNAYYPANTLDDVDEHAKGRTETAAPAVVDEG